MLSIGAACLWGVAEQFEMDRQCIQRRPYFVGQSSRGVGQTLHGGGRADVLPLLHDQTVNQIQTRSYFVVTPILGARLISAGFSLPQGFANQSKTARIGSRGQKRTQ